MGLDKRPHKNKLVNWKLVWKGSLSLGLDFPKQGMQEKCDDLLYSHLEKKLRIDSGVILESSTNENAAKKAWRVSWRNSKVAEPPHPS